MQISLTELKTNTGKYIALAEEQDIYITRNGKRAARLRETLNKCHSREGGHP